MVWLENPSGWRVYKWRRGYGIARAHPPLRRRLHQVGPAVLHGLFALVFWALHRGDHRYDERLTLLITAMPFSLLFGLWFLRPRELLVNTRQGIVFDGRAWSIRFPISQVKLFVQRDASGANYHLYIYDGRTAWGRLIWESNDETELAGVAAEVFGDTVAVEESPGDSGRTVAEL